MEIFMSTSNIIIVAALGIAVFVVMTYNRLIALREAVRNAKEQIDIQLDRRFKVFENLIEVVKKAMDYEQTTLKDVVALRNQALNARSSGNEAAAHQAEDAISKIASSISVVFENYPELKANSNAMQLQEEIVNTENKLSFAKQYFNDSLERFNAYKLSFFASIVVKIFPALNQEFAYWQLSEEREAELENFNVKMS